MTGTDKPFLHLQAPFAMESLAQEPSSTQLEQEQQENISLLRMLYFLDERHADRPQEEGDSTGVEMHRLELKMDFLLQMLGSLLADRLQLPERASLAINAQGLVFTSPGAASMPQDLLRLSIYLQPLLHRPLIVYGKSTAGEDGCGLSWWHISEQERHWLDRLVFRQHRRAVARKKPPG